METVKTRENAAPSWGPLAQLLTCYALFDFFASGMISSWQANKPSLVFAATWLFVSGSLLGQCGAISVWSALGPGNAGLRWTACLFAALGLTCLFLGGLPLFTGNRAFPAGSVKTLLVLPTVLLCAQFPLWILRLGWGYYLVVGVCQPPRQQFSLRELLLATTFIAVAMAGLRAGATSALAAGGWALGGLAFATLVVLPCLLFVFRARSAASGAMKVAIYIAILALPVWSGARVAGSRGVRDVVFSSTVLFGSALVVLQGSLVLLKSRGYSLRRISVESPGVERMKLLIHPPVDVERLSKIAAAAGNMTVVNAADAGEALREVADADAFFGKLTPELLAASRRLRWVQSPTASLEHYIFPELVEHPIVLTNMRGLFSDVIADQVLGYVLCFARNLHLYIRNQLEAKWAPVGGEGARVSFASGPGVVSDIDRAHWHLADATLGIVGLGAIGSEIARRALAFGMRVLAVDPVQKTAPNGVAALWPSAKLPDLLLDSDFVVVAAPHTPHTEKMFRREQFQQMRRTSYFINIGRGAIVDLADLMAALEAGEIAGAALDVFETEPLPAEHPLWKLQNVILTPHIAGYSPRIAERHLGVLIENIGRFTHGEPLKNVVDKALWY